MAHVWGILDEGVRTKWGYGPSTFVSKMVTSGMIPVVTYHYHYHYHHDHDHYDYHYHYCCSYCCAPQV